MKINFYEQLSKPSVLKTITVNEWFKLIRYSDSTPRIISARNQPELIQLLKQEVPCVTYNFIYSGYKKDCNIISSTGLLFIDIDATGFNIDIIDKSKVLGYYKSISGKGYHIIVRIDGITKGNFKPSYLKVCKELGILEYIDINAIKPSQFSLLSYDEDAYLNDNPSVFNVTNPSVSPSGVLTTSFSNDNTCIPFGSNTNNNRTYTYDGDTHVRFNNLDEIKIEMNEKYLTNWNGYEYIKCWIPVKKLKDGRKRFLLSYTTNFVWLNPKLNYEKYLLILNNVNNAAFETPLPQDRIQGALNTILKQLKEGSLYPIVNWKKRKIVFNPKFNFESGEKQDIVLNEIAIYKTENSIEKLKCIINEWDAKFGIITARNIYKTIKLGLISKRMSNKTICKYYKIFKQEIELKNAEISKLVSEKQKNKNSFNVIFGGLYQFENYQYDWANNDIYFLNIESQNQNFLGSNQKKINDLIDSLKEMLRKVDVLDSAERKELYETVKLVTKLDSKVDFDILYTEMFNYHNDCRRLAFLNQAV